MNSNKIAFPNKTSVSSGPQYDSKFYMLAAAGVAGLLGGMYFIWTLLADEEELDEKEIIEIEELKNNVEQNKGQIDKETALHILYLINHHSEEEIKKNKPDIEKRRRDAFNNENEYKTICEEYLEAKEMAYMRSSQRILAEFNTTMEALNQIISTVDPMEMEKKFFEFEKPTFENNIIPSKEKSKEAFIYFGNKFMEEMQGLQAQFRQLQMNYMSNSQEAQQMAMFGLIVSKMKVEDLFFMKYSLSENQIRYLLNHHNLSTDYEIQAIQQRIASFEEMMG